MIPEIKIMLYHDRFKNIDFLLLETKHFKLYLIQVLRIVNSVVNISFDK